MFIEIKKNSQPPRTLSSKVVGHRTEITPHAVFGLLPLATRGATATTAAKGPTTAPQLSPTASLSHFASVWNTPPKSVICVAPHSWPAVKYAE